MHRPVRALKVATEVYRADPTFRQHCSLSCRLYGAAGDSSDGVGGEQHTTDTFGFTLIALTTCSPKAASTAQGRPVQFASRAF